MNSVFDFSLFFTALGLVFVFEALPWIVSPSSIREVLQRLSELPDQVVRVLAMGLLIFGLMIIWITRTFSS